MSRLTRRAEADGVKAVWYGNREVFLEGETGYAEAEKLAHYEDLEEQGELLNTHQAAVILAEAFGYEHPCNFNGIDEWFPEACDCADLCPDGKMSAIACWEKYIKIKLAELKGGAE